jgi:hypothetical protein
VLLVAAGLLLRALQEGLRTDLGFDADRVVAVGLYLPHGEFEQPRRETFAVELLDRIRGMAPVEAAR